MCRLSGLRREDDAISSVPNSDVRSLMTSGDTFVTTCMYDTGTAQTKFGLGSENEMCVDFLGYW